MQTGFYALNELFRVFRQPIVLLDLEATGGDLLHDRITEIAFLHFDGHTITPVQQLINPQQPISPFIATLTGIDDDLVADAPNFAHALPQLLPYLRGSLIVAHNSHFDYSLLCHEFARAGLPFATATLCTVKLSKKLYPHEYKHNLDSIATRFHIEIEGHRHRAMTDVSILAQFLDIALKADWQNACTSTLMPPILPDRLPENLRADLAQFSDSHGVAVWHHHQKIDMHICEHGYRETVTQLHQQHKHFPDKIEWFPTVGALHSYATYAQLCDKWHLSEHRPSGRFTVMLRNHSGCLKTKIMPLNNGIYPHAPHGLFVNSKAAKKQLAQWAEKYHICPTLLGILPHTLPENSPCPVSQIKKCSQACQTQNIDLHNQTLLNALKNLPVCDAGITGTLRETARFSHESHDFIIQNGALQLPDGRWFFHADLLKTIKQKWKFERKSFISFQAA